MVYRLADLVGKPAVVVAEGEEDVDRLWAIGIPATCNLEGAAHWTDSDTVQLKQAGVERVRVIGDHDDAGRRHNTVVARSCTAHGIDARPVLLPGVPDKGDVSDFLDAHGATAKADLEALLRAAPPWTDPEPAGRDDANDNLAWPVPAAIQNALPPVTTFSEDLLPAAFRPLVRDVTMRMQVPMDYPATAIVLCLAGVVSRRAVVQPKAHDTAWQVIPNLWGGIIAPPGFMKSPVIQATTRPLEQMQSEWRAQHDAAASTTAGGEKNSSCAVRRGKRCSRRLPRRENQPPSNPRTNPLSRPCAD